MAYRRILHKALMHRPTVIGLGTALVVAAVLILPTIGYELMPVADEGEVSVTAELPVGTRIERAQDVAVRLESLIEEYVPEKEIIITQAGGGGFGGSASRSQATIRLVNKEKRTRTSEEIARDLNRQLTGVIPGVIISTRASGGNSAMNRLLGGGDSRLALEIRGDDLQQAREISQAAKDLMDKIPEAVRNARIGREEGRPELAIEVDRPKAALLGLSVTNVANSIRTSVGGTQAAFFRQHGNEYPIIVRLREEDRERVEDINDVLINAPPGQVLQAKNLMTLRNQSGPTEIQRKNQERILRVTAEPEIALSEAVKAVNERMGEVRVSPQFQVGFGAEVEEQERAFKQLQMMLILAVVLVYAVMASQYESLRDPFIIMFSVPLAAIGVVLALKLTNTTFSLQAYIGVIMLAGIVVSNAILLVDYTNILRRRDGMALREAVETAGRTRLRPIIMTTLATILGLVPMALGIGDGAELQAPLARVVIGGLTASTLITLVFVPTVYTLFEEGWKGLRAGAAEALVNGLDDHEKAHHRYSSSSSRSAPAVPRTTCATRGPNRR